MKLVSDVLFASYILNFSCNKILANNYQTMETELQKYFFRFVNSLPVIVLTCRAQGPVMQSIVTTLVLKGFAWTL